LKDGIALAGMTLTERGRHKRKVTAGTRVAQGKGTKAAGSFTLEGLLTVAGGGRGRGGMLEVVRAAVVHDQGPDQHGEEDHADQGPFLAGEGEGTRKGGQPVGQGNAFFALSHFQGAF